MRWPLMTRRRHRDLMQQQAEVFDQAYRHVLGGLIEDGILPYELIKAEIAGSATDRLSAIRALIVRILDRELPPLSRTRSMEMAVRGLPWD